MSAKIVFIITLLLFLAVPVAAGGIGDQPVEYQPLSALAIDVAGIAIATGLLFFLVKKGLPDNAKVWYFDEHAWLVNVSVVGVSVGLAIVGAWLNWMGWEPRSVVEYVWKGLFSAAVATLGYEFSKNLGRKE